MGVYDTILLIRNPANPIAIIKALTLTSGKTPQEPQKKPVPDLVGHREAVCDVYGAPLTFRFTRVRRRYVGVWGFGVWDLGFHIAPKP